MKINWFFPRIIPVLVILTLLTTPTYSQIPVKGFGGYVSQDVIFPGDKIQFGGSVYNFDTRDILVRSMNVTFVEVLAESALRDPKRFNYSRTYGDENRQLVVQNSTFTDQITREIDIDIAAYNVSIFFVYSNDTATTPQPPTYALINQSVIMEGTPPSVKVFRTIGYILAGIVVAVITYILYRSRFRRY